MARVTNLLLTGRPGVGKTTVIRKVAERVKGRGVAGFVTEEVRDRSGNRKGFRAVTLEGEKTTIADVGLSGSPRVSKYGVDVEAIDRLAEDLAPRKDVEMWLIDEIGKMECLSERFVDAMERLLDSETPVVATIGKKGPGLIATAKKRDDAEMWEVIESNRDELPDRIVEWLDRG
jgi:nucleoside-triphosphatase